MPLYFSYDSEGDGFTIHKTAEEAKLASNNDLACYRDYAVEGWDESVTHVCWGEIKESAIEINKMTKEEAKHAGIYVNNEFDYICDYELKPV